MEIFVNLDMSELQKHILTLTIPERIRLISFIASSISENDIQENFVTPDSWIQEALERDRLFTNDEQQGYTWDEVKARVDDK